MKLNKVLLFTVCVLLSNTLFAKTVLITGGMSGIGKEIATKFAAEGWDVWVTSRTPEKYSINPKIKARKLDLRDTKAITNLIKEITQNSKSIDVLINNASYSVIGPQEAISMAQAKEVFAVNVLAPMQLTKEVLPIMRKQHSGHIINIGDTHEAKHIPELAIYSSSKVALESMSKSLAQKTPVWNIKISVINPGIVNNSWARNCALADKITDFPGSQEATSSLKKYLSKKAKDGISETKVANTIYQLAIG